MTEPDVSPCVEFEVASCECSYYIVGFAVKKWGNCSVEVGSRILLRDSNQARTKYVWHRGDE